MKGDLLNIPMPEIDELVPHSGDMSLLDEVVEFSGESVFTKATIAADNPFVVDQSISSWIGIEYMAQTIAAWAGMHAVSQGEPIKMGFLVGSRAYSPADDSFAVGTELHISATQVMEGANGLKVFECELRYEGGQVSANINVFQPEDIEVFLRGQIDEK